MVPEPLIQIQGLYKIFGQDPNLILPLVREGQTKEKLLVESDHTIGLDDINLDIGYGEVFVLMGLSGSGKSTLIRTLNRLIEPTAGSIHIGGTNVLALDQRALEKFRRQKLSMVFQSFALLPHRTVIDNVGFGLSIRKIAKDERYAKAQNWIEKVGLKGYENQFPAQLSGGQQQRVGLARALCTNPQILLMDEAFSALDPLIRSEMQQQLIDLQKDLKKTVVFITHDLEEALRIGNRIAILNDGRISQVGTPKEILENPADDYVTAFVRDVKRAF
tara:strand:- start:1115 stop:1939 length:825 start_codon:yes stop_codon:yes gene_type:complete